MKTLDDQWRAYLEVGVPADADEIERQTIKLAFYAGAAGFYNSLADGLAGQPGSDLVVASRFEALTGEIKAYLSSGQMFI